MQALTGLSCSQSWLVCSCILDGQAPSHAKLFLPAARVTYALHQDWSPAASRFWPVVLVDELIVSINGKLPLALHSTRGTAQGSNYHNSAVRPANLQEDRPYASASAAETAAYSDFVTPMRELTREANSVLLPLHQIMHADIFMSDHMLEVLMPLAWGSFDAAERSHFSSGLITLLTKSYHRCLPWLCLLMYAEVAVQCLISLTHLLHY